MRIRVHLARRMEGRLMGHDDPNIGPDHLPGPDVGGSITFDDSGHVTQIGVDVPGSAEGSDQATWDFSHHGDAPAADPGWMPHVSDEPTIDFMHMPPPEGFHWDPITHVAVPNAVPDWPVQSEEPDYSQPGDYPEPASDPDLAEA